MSMYRTHLQMSQLIVFFITYTTSTTYTLYLYAWLVPSFVAEETKNQPPHFFNPFVLPIALFPISLLFTKSNPVLLFWPVLLVHWVVLL